MKTPCRECKFREIGCHSKCESYKQYRASLDKLKKNTMQLKNGIETI